MPGVNAGRTPRIAAASALVMLGALGLAGVARAQTPTPTASPTPQLSGNVTGSLVAGGTLRVRIDATMAGGWQNLHEIIVGVVVAGRETDQLVFDVEDWRIGMGEQHAVVGTGSTVSGEHLRVDGSRVIVTTGGAHLAYTAQAQVVRAIPTDARFLLSAENDFGGLTEKTVGLAEPPSSGITWGTVFGFVAVALLAGALFGNLFAQKRRPPPRVSVYGAVQRRLEEEQSSSRSKT